MGAENQVVVELQTLDGVASELGVFNADITAQLDDLERLIAQLHVQWSGSGAIPAAAVLRLPCRATLQQLQRASAHRKLAAMRGRPSTGP